MKFRNYINEAKNGRMRGSLRTLDNAIDAFLDRVEAKVDRIDDNPAFQKKMNQMLIDVSKEHAEFIMALRQLVNSLDRGPQLTPKRIASAKFLSREPEEGEEMMPPEEEGEEEAPPAPEKKKNNEIK